MRAPYRRHRDDDDFIQPRMLVEDVLTPTEVDHLVRNIVAHASQGVSDDVKARVIDYWRNVHDDLGARVAKGLNGD